MIPIESVERKELTREEEYEMVRRAQAGDLDARNDMVVWNVPFIHVVVERMMTVEYYRIHGVYPDMVQAGVFGLIRAIEKFDLSRAKPVKFLTYASYWIRAQIQYDVFYGVLFRLPTYAMQEQHKNPNAHYNTSAKTKAAIDRFKRMSFSVSTETLEYDLIRSVTQTVFESKTKAENFDSREYAALIKGLIEDLPDQQRMVIKGRMAGSTFKAIGEKVGLTPERIRQVETLAHMALKERVEGTTLEPYWWLKESDNVEVEI